MGIFSKLSYKEIALIPIEVEHKEQLRQNAQFDEIWTHTSLMNKYSPDLYDAWFALAFNNSQTGYQNCFIIKHNNKYVGSSRYYGIKSIEKEISIGFTWLTPSVWGTEVNPTCKYLLLKNAFDNGYNKVFFHTDNKNVHSQTAIKKLGAEYVQTKSKDKMRPDGSLRDTVEFVLSKENWNNVRQNLLQRIEK